MEGVAGGAREEWGQGGRSSAGRDDARGNYQGWRGADYLQVHQCPRGQEVFEECSAILKASQPDAWTTFNTLSLLGGSLLGQKKYADAEPLLLKGYEGMKAREKAIPPQGATRLPEAARRLVELYEATGDPEKAAKWRIEWAGYTCERLPPPKARD